MWSCTSRPFGKLEVSRAESDKYDCGTAQVCILWTLGVANGTNKIIDKLCVKLLFNFRQNGDFLCVL